MKKDKWIRIGTRESQLAMWQAHFVKNVLEAKGHFCELVPITSDGEIETVKPLYEMGVTGVFTKTLDIALLSGEIDIAVHSLKDVPTKLPVGLCIAAVPKRGDHRDAIVTKENEISWEVEEAVIATSSIRRKAQWLYRFPHHRTENIRGNINTRLKKLESNSSWHGAIFATVGIERIGLAIPHMEILEWMIPAPSQGALGIVCREEDQRLIDICKSLNDESSRLAVDVERGFLRALMGGCATPIACFAEVVNDQLKARAQVISLGPEPEKKELKISFTIEDPQEISKKLADKMLANGGIELVDKMRNSI